MITDVPFQPLMARAGAADRGRLQFYPTLPEALAHRRLIGRAAADVRGRTCPFQPLDAWRTARELEAACSSELPEALAATGAKKKPRVSLLIALLLEASRTFMAVRVGSRLSTAAAGAAGRFSSLLQGFDGAPARSQL